MNDPLNPRPEPSPANKVRIVLADDHQLVLAGLRGIIDNQDDMQVVAETTNGNDAVRLVVELRPAILLVDVSMPGMTGVDVTRAVRAAAPEARVIGVTRHRESKFVAAMFAAGAAGYVLKQSPSAELLRAIRMVTGGTDFIDSALPQRHGADTWPIDPRLVQPPRTLD
jgi:DNA-binding NarL/FixJ family response regulator